MKIEKNKNHLIFALVAVFSIFVALSCVAASDVDVMSDNNTISEPVDNGQELILDNATVSEPVDNGQEAILDNATVSEDADNGPEVISDNNTISEKLHNNPRIILDENNNFTMTAKYHSGTPSIWKVSPESYGVEISKPQYVVDHPSLMGFSGTVYFNIHVISDDYYVRLVLVNIVTGAVVDEMDSDFLDWILPSNF